MIPLHGYSLTQLRRFLELASELHFSRTAERLGISQPLLSEQIRDLEAQLRVKLFDRSSRRVELTPAGHLLKDRMSLIFLAFEEAIKAARDLHGGGNMPIRIGYTDEFTRFLLPDLVAHLKSADPSAKIALESHTVPSLLEMVDSGVLDIALLSPMFEGPPEPSWDAVFFPPIPLSVGLSHNHPLANSASLRLEELAELPFLECPADRGAASAGTEVLVDRLFARRSLRRHIIQRLDDPHLAAALAAAGVGALITNFSGISDVPGLKVIPLDEADAVLTCGAVSRRSNHTTLLNLCRTYLSERATAR